MPWYLSWIITTLVLVVVALGKMLNKEGNLLNSAIVALQQMLKRGATLIEFLKCSLLWMAAHCTRTQRSLWTFPMSNE